MGTVSISIPNEMKKEMAKIDEVNWSAVARKAFEEKVKQMKFLKKIAQKSELTKENAEEIANKINLQASKKFKETK